LIDHRTFWQGARIKTSRKTLGTVAAGLYVPEKEPEEHIPQQEVRAAIQIRAAGGLLVPLSKVTDF
jgi:hypothetical protein